MTAGGAAAARALAMLADAFAPDAPGVQYVVVDRERVLFEDARGLADVARRVPVTPRTTMAAFSMTKTITAIAVLQLAERGALRLDDPAGAYVVHPYDPSLTVRQLLTHTAGVPNPLPLRWVHLAEEHARFDEGAALAAVLARHPRQKHPPGERYAYSNIGYWLLGKVVERASGRAYADHVRERVFAPLGLGPGEIGFGIADPANHANGYLDRRSLLNLVRRFVTDGRVWAGTEGSWRRVKHVALDGPAFGGAVGSAGAFARLLQDQLRDESALLTRASRDLMATPARTAAGEPVAMTPGWHVGELAGARSLFKEGGGAGFHAEMRLYPERGLASVIMVNRTSFDSNRFLGRLDRAWLEEAGGLSGPRR